MKNQTRIDVDAILQYWRDVHDDIQECLKRTPDDLLSWAPKEGMKTFGQLYVHLATAIDWNLTNVFKDGGLWVPSAEHPTDDKEMLDAHLVASFERLDRYSRKTDLSRTLDLKARQVTGAWLFIHMFDHHIHHRAQLKTYLRMNGITPPGSD